MTTRLHPLSALVDSQVALKTDAGKPERFSTDVAGEPADFWCHGMVLLLVAPVSTQSHELVAILFTLSGFFVTFCSLAATVFGIWREHIRCDFEFLENAFHIIFMTLFLPESLLHTRRQYSIKNLYWLSVVFHPYYMSDPSRLSSPQQTLQARVVSPSIGFFMSNSVLPCNA